MHARVAGVDGRRNGMARKANPKVELLRAVSLFEGLATKELESVADLCRTAEFRQGANIVTQGERSARLYVVTDGTAEVRVHGTKVDEIGPGDYFGEIAVIDGQPRAATVTATSPVSALSLADFNVKALIRSTPDIGLKMLKTACARIRALESGPII
jgi:CRP/FNR family transcriptional regulator, cyclic AMP receptor protein